MPASSSCPKPMVRGSRAEQPRPASPKARTPRAGAPGGSAAMATKARGGHERQEVVGAPRREAALDGGEEHPPHRDHPPERGEGQRGQGAARAHVRGHVDGGPVAVHRLHDAVEQGEPGEDPEAGRPGGADLSAPGRGLHGPHLDGRRAEGQGQAEGQQAQQQHRHQQGQAPPDAQADEDGGEDRGQGRPQPQQGVQDQHGALDRRGEEGGGEGVEGRHGQAEAGAEAGRGQQQQAVGQGLVASSRPGSAAAPPSPPGRPPGPAGRPA